MRLSENFFSGRIKHCRKMFLFLYNDTQKPCVFKPSFSRVHGFPFKFQKRKSICILFLMGILMDTRSFPGLNNSLNSLSSFRNQQMLKRTINLPVLILLSQINQALYLTISTSLHYFSHHQIIYCKI